MYRHAAKFLLLFVLLLASCSPAATATPTPTKAIVINRVVTESITNTPTTEPTATIPPTQTPSPIPEATATSEASPTTEVTITGNSKIAWFESFKVGVNLAGGDFSRLEPAKVPGTLGTDYYYPSCTLIEEWAARGIKSIRYAVLLQRIVKDGKLTQDAEYIAETLDCASNLGIGIILDLHDAWYSDGTSLRPITTEELVEFWRLIAERFGSHPALIAYGLVNEPHQLGSDWPAMAQAAVNGIREIDTTTPIIISGFQWSGTATWMQHSANLHTQVVDPYGLEVFEGHNYPDRYTGNNADMTFSGQYLNPPPDPLGGDTEKAVETAMPFTTWCETNNRRCIVGEIGFSYADPAWQPSAYALMEHYYTAGIPVYGYAGGDPNWWGNRNISLEKEESWFREILSEFANR